MGIRISGERARRVDQRQLAAHLSISQATVCRALGGKPSVAPELREAVLRAAEELGYTPNVLGRNLVRQSSRTIGIVASAVNRPFYARAIHGAEQNADGHGYYTMICTTDGRLEREEQALRLLASQLVDGLIFISASGNRRNEHIQRFHRMNPHLVLINRYGPLASIDTVLIDNEGGLRMAAEHLADQGHRRIAVFGSAVGQNGSDRLAGCRLALQARGLVPLETAPATNFDITVAQAAAARLLAGPDRPTAIITINDLLAVGVYHAAAEAGLRIPHDLAVIAWDDFGYGQVLNPPMSVVIPPWEEAGQVATELLLRRLARPTAPPQRVVLACSLEVASSTTAASADAGD